MNYQETVIRVMNFLKEKGVCSSSRHSHLECYSALGDYLQKNGKAYSKTIRESWFSQMRLQYSSQRCVFWEQYILQLEEMDATGYISDRRLYQIISTYEKLPLPLKNALDRYLDECKSHYTARTMDTTRIECSVFLLALADNGVTQTEDINFQVLCSFIELNLRSKRHSKNILCQYASRMFEYWGIIGLCDSNFAFLLDNQMYPHIGNIEHFPAKAKEKIDSLREESLDFPSSDIRDSIPQFIETLEKHGYVGTTLKLANHALTTHYLFLYFNGLGFHPDILWLWFEEVKKTLEISWLHWRRVLSFYLEYTKIGDILPNGKYKYAPTQYDHLPDWCKIPLSAFLERKQNEHRSTGTIRPYRCSCSVFCSFLVQSGINSFSQLSVEIINLFISQDSHTTFRGRTARFVHLRGFLLFLEEQGYTTKHGLYNCFLTGTAPVEKIVDVLTPEQISRIESYRGAHNNPIELRDIAIVLLGLKMGFRASDITHLCFSNIDWKKHEISIVMQKTKVEIKLPMPVDVGNAIYAYLKDGRPASKDRHIFLRTKAPYGILTSKICSMALWRILPEREKVKGGGFHVTRRTFATNLLRNNAEIDTVMDSLGHTDPTSVMKYLLLDENRMPECALSLQEAGISMGGVSA